MSSSGGSLKGRQSLFKVIEEKTIRPILSSEELSILAIFILIVAVVSISVPKFRTLYNALVVLRQFSLITIVSIGQAIVLVSGVFDLSVGSIVALAGMAGTYLCVTIGWPLWASILSSVGIGALCGLFNGFLVARVKINAIIATLASGWIFSGIILVTTKGWPISNFPERFAYLGQGYFLGLPLPVMMMLVITVLATLFMSKTTYGRYLYAIGGNERSSYFAGLNLRRYRIMSYVICGILAGFAGIVLDSRMGSAQAQAGVDWTLPSVAAAVIGGVSLYGGKGKIYGVLIGSALLGIINNILVLLHISSYWQSLISGFVLILAVGFDSFRRGRRQI